MQPVPSTTARPTSPTYAIWQLWDRLFRSGRLKALTHAEATTLQALVHHMRTADWVTWVSVETLTGYLPGVRSTVQRSIRALVAKGFVQIEERSGQSNLVALSRQMLADLEIQGQQVATPRGRNSRRIRADRGRNSQPEQSNQIQNLVGEQQQAAPEPVRPEAAAAPSKKVDLPKDLQDLADQDRTIGRRFLESLVQTHGIEVTRTAITAIRERYDDRGVIPHNRGGMLRRAVAEGWVPTVTIEAEQKTAKAAEAEAHRPPSDATWGRSPSGRVVRVIEVASAAVQIVDSRGVDSMVPMWAVAGWTWGTGAMPE